MQLFYTKHAYAYGLATFMPVLKHKHIYYVQ